MNIPTHIIRAKEAAEADLLALTGVTGVSIGYKYVSGRRTDEISIRVSVKKKSDVPAPQRIPTEIGGVKTDVLEQEFHTLQVLADPIQGGVSTGTARSFGRDALGPLFVDGTLGTIAEDNRTGLRVIVSNFHILCPSGFKPGDPIVQPSMGNGARAGSGLPVPATIVATLTRAALTGEVDAAVATLSGGLSRGSRCAVLEIGDIVGAREPEHGEPVRKRGQKTGLTFGFIDALHATETIGFGDPIGPKMFKDLIEIRPFTNRNTLFSEHGDSGSAIVGDDRRVVGLLFAGGVDPRNGDLGLANHILTVFRELDIRICTQWASEGGGLTSNIAVGRNDDGRLEVFVKGDDDALYHKWQTKPGRAPWSDPWSAERGITFVGDPTVVRNDDGRLEVFVRGDDGALHHVWQKKKNGVGGWSGWASEGGGLTSNVAVGRNDDGRLEVFVKGDDDALYHKWQTKPGRAPWSDWFAERGITFVGDPTVVRNDDGRLEVFVRGADNTVQHVWQTGNSAHPWSGWASEGGGLTSNVAVGRNDDGRLEVFVKGDDDALYHKWQTKPGRAPWSDPWSAERGITFVGDPTVVRNDDGRLEVFVRGDDGALHHVWQKKKNGVGGWSGWASEGGPLASDPAAAQNADGRLEVFVRGTDAGLWHRWQTAPNNGWN